MTPEFTHEQIEAFRDMFAFTPEQYVAFSWVAMEKGDPGAWRNIDPERLSFTEPGWGPAEQAYGTLDRAFRILHIIPGSDAGLGFAARTNPDGTVNEEDARRKRNQWVIFLPRPADDT
jgi:hypothetical protein